MEWVGLRVFVRVESVYPISSAGSDPPVPGLVHYGDHQPGGRLAGREAAGSQHCHDTDYLHAVYSEEEREGEWVREGGRESG